MQLRPCSSTPLKTSLRFSGPDLLPESIHYPLLRLPHIPPSPWVSAPFAAFNRHVMLPYIWNIQEVNVKNWDVITQLQKDGAHLIFAPNHPGMGDTYALKEAFYQNNVSAKAFASDQMFHVLDRILPGQWVKKTLHWLGLYEPDPFKPPGLLQQLWHGFLIRLGIMPFHRDASDSEAIRRNGIQTVMDGQYPLVIFPEGRTAEHSEQMGHVEAGLTFIGVHAARRLLKSNPKKKVVIVPIAIKVGAKNPEELIPKLVVPLETLERKAGFIPAPLSASQVTPQVLMERLDKVWLRTFHAREKQIFGNAPHYATTTQQYQHLTNRLASHLETVTGLEPAPDTPLIERLRTVRKRLYNMMHRAGQDSLPTLSVREKQKFFNAELPKLQMAWNLLRYIPEYFSPEHANADRVAESMMQLGDLLNEKVNLLFQAPRFATFHVGQPIQVTQYLQQASDSESLRETMANLNARYQNNMKAALAEATRNPRPATPVSA